MTAPTFDIGTFLESDASFQGGRPFIRGKRVTVQRVAILYSQGMTDADIAEDFNLDLAEVHAALCYYLANRDAIDADVRGQDAAHFRVAAEFPSLRAPG
jgi:uncharacterized protein (DUF433 family)